MKATLAVALPATAKSAHKARGGKVPAGTEIDGPAALFYVGMGAARPADDECRARCGLTPEQIEQKIARYGEKLAGIQPGDLAAYRAGAMLGYDPATGNWIPGPNYDEWIAEHQEAEQEDDED